MKIRTVVLLILIASIVYALPFMPTVAQTLQDIWQQVITDPGLVQICLLSAILVLVGHMIRAYRDTILFSQATKTSVKYQFSAFSIGSFCNLILPLRIGELMRADVLAQRYQISFSFSFVLICIERLFDVLILGAFTIIMVHLNVPLMIVTLTLTLFLFLVAAPTSVIKKGIQKTSQIFNERLQAKILFTLWSLEYGLKRTLKPRLLIKYGLLSVLNWCIYLGSLLPLIITLQGPEHMLKTSICAFLSLTTSIAPGALGDFTHSLESFGFIAPSMEPIILWIVAVAPIALIGLLVTLFGIKTLPLLRPKAKATSDSSLNKLSRDSDISSDQLHFMNDYYSGKPLAQKVTQAEIAGVAVMSRYFTSGGSGALTFQSVIKGKRCVTKLVSQEKSASLRAQYHWLKEHEHPCIVKTINEHEDDDSYSINIEYEENATDFFEQIHTQPLEKNMQLLEGAIAVLAAQAWKTLAPPPTDASRLKLISKRTFSSL